MSIAHISSSFSLLQLSLQDATHLFMAYYMLRNVCKPLIFKCKQMLAS